MQLRKVIQQDNTFVLEGLSDDAVTKHMLIRYKTLDSVQEQMDHYAAHYEKQTGCYWVMEARDSGDAMGVIGLNNFSAEHRKAEIGFWMLPRFWNKGFTTEAGNAVISHCFDNLGLNRLEATVETENKASEKAVRKLGMLHEGTFRQYEMNNGKPIDLMMFAILQQDRKASR